MGDSIAEVAVTGAGGFIGSHLVEALLARGHRVRALVHYNALGSIGHLGDVAASERLAVVAGDVTDARCVRALVEGCGSVFHLAALIGIPYSYAAPQSYVQTNVVGTLNVLEACRDLGVGRLLHTSTSEVYGTARTTPMSEAHPLQAQSPYAASKIAADKLVESYCLSYGLPAVTIRPFNTYGPRQSLRAIIPTIIAQALSPDCPSIRLGSMDPMRDFTFVGDTVGAFCAAAEAPAAKVVGRVFNLGVGQGITIGNLAEMILRLLKVEKPIEQGEERQRPAASEVRVLVSDNRSIRNEVGWNPAVGLEEGLARTADYLRPRLQQLNPRAYRT